MTAEASHVQGDFPVYFRYTVGIAGERFLREIKDNGKLVASRCTKCNLNYLPPRIYCERCMSRLEEYVTIQDTGTVENLTICHRDAEGRELIEPVVVAFIRFPSAHGGIIHRAKGPIAVGDKLHPVFKERSKRTGSILDIEHFEKTR
jgi:uncharacterized OB-fold protein